MKFTKHAATISQKSISELHIKYDVSVKRRIYLELISVIHDSVFSDFLQELIFSYSFLYIVKNDHIVYQYDQVERRILDYEAGVRYGRHE